MRSLLLLTILVLFNLPGRAQFEAICIPNGNSVGIDGIISPNEWSDADSLTIGGGTLTKVYYKHDGMNFLIAFVGNLQSSSRFPEILFDIDHDRSIIWANDDWWFHISAQDCEYKGEYGNYDSCDVVRPNWTAEQNMNPGPPMPPLNDTIEVEIPFSTLNITPSNSDTIGITFLVSNLVNSWEHWPASADRNSPSSWGLATFSCQTTDISEDLEIETPVPNIYPNPTKGNLTISFEDTQDRDIYSVKILDINGKNMAVKWDVRTINSKIELDLSDFPPGTYFLRMEGKDFYYTERKIILR